VLRKRLETSQLMLYLEIIAVRFETHNNRRNTLLGELDLFSFKMALRKVDLITGRQKVNVPLKYFACHYRIFCVPVFYKFSSDICIKSWIIAISMHKQSDTVFRKQWSNVAICCFVSLMWVQILVQQVVYPFADHFDVSRSLKENSEALPQIADTFSKQTINVQTNKTRMHFEDQI